LILKWGAYAFDDNEVWFQIIRRVVYSPRGRRMWTKHTWIVTGVKIGDDAADLTSKLTAMEIACLTDGQDLLFYDNNGAPTSHGLFTSTCINGVQATSPVHYPGGNPGIWGTGTEYTNKRTYRVVFEGDLLHFDDDLVRSHETLSYIGNGGQLNIWQESFIGLPQPQTPKLFTKRRLIQQGSAIGLTTTPIAPAPLFGNPYIRNDLSMTEPGTALRVGINFDTHYPLRWRYVFEGV
jgi:hypothetical protein